MGFRPGLLRPPRAFRGYLFALAAVALMAAVRWLLDPFLGETHPYDLFLAAVFLSTWNSGWKPGLFALVLGLLAAHYQFVSPRFALMPADVGQAVGLLVYLAVGTVNVALIERIRNSARERGRVLDQLAREVDARLEAQNRVCRLAAIVDSSEDAVVGWTYEGVITDWNDGARRLFGHSEEVAVGRHASFLLPPGSPDAAGPVAERLRRGEVVPPYEAVRLRKDGTRVSVSVQASAIVRDGRVVGLASIVRDLTHTRALEAQQRQAQKMEALGKLAGGVAHDFNNLLTVINGYGNLVLPEIPPESVARKWVESIVAAGDRAEVLTRQLLAFSRQQAVAPEVLDLNALVENLRGMLGRLIGENYELSARLAPGLWSVEADPGQVVQVVLNLVVNARDAMPGGGRVVVETHNVGPSPAGGPRVLLAVGDSGHGMSAEVKARVFEPYFTTKELGKGTGLGLATVFGIVKRAGGEVEVDTEAGVGSTFRVYLPRAEGHAATPAGETFGPVAGGDETVLLVEDEAAVRELFACGLRSAGYRVLVASDGVEALEIATGHPGPLHLLVSDLVMPRLGGRELADHLAGKRQDLRVLFISGYPGGDWDSLPGDQSYLPKPCTVAALSRKVRELLDAPVRATERIA